MPNPATTAFEARRGGDPKHPHRRGAAIQHLPRPSVVPAPGAPAHCRIARGERAVVEKGVPGSPDRRATPADTTEARKRSPATVSIAPERPPRPPPTYPRPEYAPQNAPLRPNNQKLPLRAISGLAKARPRAARTIARRVREHDARCLPAIRRLRERGYGWRRIAGALSREGIEPPRRRAGHPEAPWLAPAVLRIARRHGIA